MICYNVTYVHKAPLVYHFTDPKMSNPLTGLQALKKIWREQNFSLDAEQQKRYDELLDERRQRVLGFYKDGRVWVGPSEAGKPAAE